MANPTGKGGFGDRKHQINRKGRPKTFDALRTLAQEISHEVATIDNKPIVINGREVTVAEAILRKWATSKDARLQIMFVEVAYGKVPNPVEVSGKDGAALTVLIKYANTDIDVTHSP